MFDTIVGLFLAAHPERSTIAINKVNA